MPASSAKITFKCVLLDSAIRCRAMCGSLYGLSLVMAHHAWLREVVELNIAEHNEHLSFSVLSSTTAKQDRLVSTEQRVRVGFDARYRDRRGRFLSAHGVLEGIRMAS